MRKAIICIAAIVLVAMLLCPPWKIGSTPRGCHMLWSPPKVPPRREFGGKYIAGKTGTIDFARLGMQVAILAVVAGTPLLLMRRPDRP